eukprot:gene23012-31323_t
MGITVQGYRIATMKLELSSAKQVAPLSAISPAHYGVNIGHSCSADDSWQVSMRRLGITKARMFGVGGISAHSLGVPSKGLGTAVTGLTNSYGSSLSGSMVTNQTAFNTAMLQLRSPNGHNPGFTGWTYPVQWGVIDLNLNQTSYSPMTDAINSNSNYIISALQELDISPLPVTQITCSTFSFSTMNPQLGVYWAERWELYKQRYAIARWMWLRGVTETEFWNEPDLSSNTCINQTTWIDMYTLSSTAIHNAYDDLNLDATINAVSCPSIGNLSCPITINVVASAFAKLTFHAAGTLGYVTVQNEHTLFPPFAGASNSKWYNLQAYSYHQYGATGPQQASNAYNLSAQVNQIHDTSNAPALPVHTTEHAAHTSSSWKSIKTSSDDSLEASRLAMQILMQAMYGFESYIFKFSMTVSSSGGVIKSGIYFGDVSTYPFRVGDSTRSGEAARILISRIQGKKQLLSCTPVLSSPASTYRQCVTVVDAVNNLYHVLVVNDGDNSTSSATSARTPYHFTITVNLSALSVAVGSVVAIDEVSIYNGYVFHGEVSKVAVVDASYTLQHFLPAWGVASFSVSKAAMNGSVFYATDSTIVSAGVSTATVLNNQSALRIGTSTTADHSSTFVSFIKFLLPASMIKESPMALLKLTVQKVDKSAPSTCLVVGAGSTAGADTWSAKNLSWSSAGFGLRIPKGIVLNNISNDFTVFRRNYIAGHVTVNPVDTGSVKYVDITNYLKMLKTSSSSMVTVTLFIVRRVRSNTFPYGSTALGNSAGDSLNNGNSVEFYGSQHQNISSRPIIQLYSPLLTRPPPSSAAAAPTYSPVVKPNAPTYTPLQEKLFFLEQL